jgi:low temperature requirement protein LtrA
VLWFAVWLAWQYTCWVTNWFDPDAMPIRIMLLAVMLVGLRMSAALPEAFGELGLVFAVGYVVIQVGRTLTVLRYLGGSRALNANFRRILGWMSIAAVF